MRACHGEYMAFGVALAAGGLAYRIGRFLLQQGFVTMQAVQAAQTLAQVLLQATAGNLHGD
jgi:hypothetical protein